MQFEHHHEPLLPWHRFIIRLAWSSVVGLALVALSLAVGMLGFHRFFALSWIDAFVNASMILSGMGPLAGPQTTGAKLFAGAYALYSGLAVLAIAGVIFAPAIHRFLHYLHADPGDRHPQSRRGQTSV